MKSKLNIVLNILIAVFVEFFFCPAYAIDKTSLNLDFFNRFNDSYLCEYINEALENNHTAKQATARVEQYRQNVKTQFANELPTFSVSASYLGINIPKFNPSLQVQKNAFILPFIVNYEADILLKNRDKTKSTKKIYEMSKNDEVSAYLTLLSDVATVYTNILEYDKLILEQEKIISNNYRILLDNTKKLSEGIINSTELNNSITDLETSKIVLENYEKQREIILMQFAILLGRSVDCTNDIKRGSIDNFEYSKIIPDKFESDIIFSRPDVKNAELALEKAKIDIRIARKEFLPTFNIAGIWAFNTIAPGSFFSWESSLAALLAGATQDIFTGGRKVANLRFQKAKYEELFEQYRETDLNAVKEINTALCFIKHDVDIETTAKRNLTTEYMNLISSEKMLKSGVYANKQYLTSKNLYLNKNIDYTKAKTQRLVNYYTLYKAVGGLL